MSRTKGYKCFNIKCGSCIGKTLCGEPEDTALVCVDRVIGKPMTNADRIRAMSDEELADMLWKTGRNYRAVCADPVVDYNEHRDGLIAWLKQPAGRKGD